MGALAAIGRLLRFLPTWQSIAVCLAWGGFWGLAFLTGWADFLEEPLGDVLWRATNPREQTAAAWIVYADGPTAERGHDPRSVDTWSDLLLRAREESVAAVVVLDPRGARELSEALAAGDPGVRVIVPTRRREDPYQEFPPSVVRFFPPEHAPPAGSWQEGLLDFRPDPDGTWRRTALRDEAGQSTLPGLLAPGALAGRPEVRHRLSGPAGVESRISLWRILDRDVHLPGWRGSVWIVESDRADRETWSSQGEGLSEARALAQTVDALARGNWYRETPAWGTGALAAAGFFFAWLAACTLSPLRGLAVLAVSTAAVFGAFWLTRLELLWFVPVVPVLPTAVVGYLYGLSERHRMLRRGMAELLVRLGRSRVLNPILSRPASDEHDVSAFRSLLDLDAAAVVAEDSARPLVALSTREDRADLWEWFPGGVVGLVQAARATTERPLIYRPPDIGPVVLVEPLSARPGRRTWLAMVPRGDAQIWWTDHRALVGRAIIPLSSLGIGAAAVREEPIRVEQVSVPENQLRVLRSTVDQTELERTFLLGFLDRLSDGVLVCDLVGRALIYNKRFQTMAEELAVDFEDPLISFLRTISSQTNDQVWQAIGQTIRSGARWTLYASVQRHPVRHYMSNLVRLDLGSGASDTSQSISDVIALVVTEVSDLYEAERLKSELLEHFVHDVRNAVTVIAQSAEEVVEITTDEEVKPDLVMIQAQAMGIAERFRSMAALAGISAEKIADELTPTDLVSEAKRAMNASAAMAEQLGIILAYEGQTVVPFSTARPNALRQALMQVIEQSLASSPRGSTVTIGAQDEGAVVVVRVNDPGWSPMTAIGRMRGAIPTGQTLKFTAADGLKRLAEMAGGRLTSEFDEAVGTSVKLAFPKVANRLETEAGGGAGKDAQDEGPVVPPTIAGISPDSIEDPGPAPAGEGELREPGLPNVAPGMPPGMLE
ncbi:MAG: HAMP domain-containing histidine kinase [Candidatus Brocadiae bacterium]|nr:HAMP domain-containing histidine kinase [Candidatus Brocadiia bacterium]